MNAPSRAKIQKPKPKQNNDKNTNAYNRTKISTITKELINYLLIIKKKQIQWSIRRDPKIHKRADTL